MLAILLSVATVASLGVAAWFLRRLLLPTWSGSPARLAEAVLGVGAMILIGEVLGSAGALRRARS
jgi:hypothetical protein